MTAVQLTALRSAALAIAEPLERRVLLAGPYHWPLGEEFQLNSHTTGDQVRPALAMDGDGNFVVAWDGDGADGAGIYVRRFSAAGAAQGPEFRVDSPTAVNRFAPTIAMDADGDFVVAWLSVDQPGASYLPIYARRYTAAGVPLGAQFRVDHSDANQQPPRIAMDADGDFVIVWPRLTDAWRIYARRYDASGAAQGDAFQVNTFTPFGQGRPAVAMDPSGDFVIAWESYLQDGAGTGIYAQRYDAAGAAQGGEFKVNTYTTEWQEHPAVALDADGNFVIAWESDYQDGSREGVYAQRYDAAGVPQGAEFRVNTHTSLTQSQPAVAMDEEGSFVVVWFSDHDSTKVTSNFGIYAQRYSASGEAQGSEFRVNAPAMGGTNPRVAARGGDGFLITWIGQELSAQRYAAFGSVQAALAGDRVWNDSNSNGVQDGGEAGIAGVTVELYRADGLHVTTTTADATGHYQFGVFPGASALLRFKTPPGYIPTRQNQGGDDQLDSDADRATGHVALVAGPAGTIDGSIDAGFVVPASVSGVVYHDRNGDGVRNAVEEGLAGFVVFLDEDNDGLRDPGEPWAGSGTAGSYTIKNLLGGTYPIRVEQQDRWTVPAAALLVVPSSTAVSQVNFPVRTATPDSTAAPLDPQFPVNVHTTSRQAWPRVAKDADGDFVVVWESDHQDGFYTGVFGRRFNAAGVPQGNEFQVNTYTTLSQLQPKIAMDADGDFVVTWMSYGQDGWGSGVYAQRYNSAGVPQGEEFRVNTSTIGDQWYPSVAMDADGNFVIAWGSDVPSDSSSDVYAQRYDADGVPQGTEFRVNTYTTHPQRSADVAMDAAGNFVVTWMSFDQDGSLEGIYAQRYDAAGTALGTEFQVHTSTTAAQLFPAVAMDADGDFIVTWESYYFIGIYAQRYNAVGQPQGTEFRVNSPTAAGSRVSVTMDADGDAILTWRSYDGAGEGIFARRYNVAGVPQGPEFRINPDAAGNQWSAGVAMDADGDFIVAWTSYPSSYSLDGEVFARRYAVAQRPAVTSSQFVWQSAPQRLEFAFDEDVSPSLASDDILVENLTAGTTVHTSDIVVNWNAATNTATFTFPTLPNGGSLPDGNYRATLLASGVFNPAGTTIAADWAVEFFFLAGDANHDGRVNLQDFNRLAANFGQSGPGIDYTRGDFNYDNVVNLLDFNILAGRFGTMLTAAAQSSRRPPFGDWTIQKDRDEDTMEVLR